MSKKYLVTQDQTVDGMLLEDNAVIHYATCSTAAATAAKAAALSGFKLGTGAWAAVKFTVTNTAANPTLNINGTGAKAVRYRNAAVSAGALAANRIYLMVYDGTYWQIVGDLDTSYTHPTTAGNKHIPSGGAANQILTYSASGTAVWSGTCNAAAIDVVTGSRGSYTSNPATVPYKSGRTKALVLICDFADKTFYGAGQILLTELSSSMTAKKNNVSLGGATCSCDVKVTAEGNIVIQGYCSQYCIIWFN